MIGCGRESHGLINQKLIRRTAAPRRAPHPLTTRNGKITLDATNPSAPPSSVSHARAVSSSTECTPLAAIVTMSTKANAPHAMSYRSGNAIA